MSSGSAAHTASVTSRLNARPLAVAARRFSQVANVWPSRRAAPGAAHGASRGTRRTPRAGAPWSVPVARDPAGVQRGGAPAVAGPGPPELGELVTGVVGGE